MMVAMGFFGNKEDLGLEGSGIVLQVGPDVTDIVVGDRVMLMHSGVLASNVVVPQEACIKLPQGLSMADAATMLTAYVTVLYSLLEIGALKKGQASHYCFLPILMVTDLKTVRSHSLGVRWGWTSCSASMPGCWYRGQLTFL
jgi:D-arabinose 1-dehydrogenase-like Zn-dependent alcohol dehydrogenase